nr:hypothetical protein [Tanacetum cinerariifolium]
PKRQRFYGFASNRTSPKDVYSRKRIIAVTSLKIMKWYDYGHFDEIEVRREDQQLYKFKEVDFPRLRLRDIRTFTSLKIMKWYDYDHLDEIEVRREDQQLYKFKEVDFPRLRLRDIRTCYSYLRVEDLQLGVQSYQKKLNLTKPDTFRLDIRNKTAYTAYSDPQGVIYED